MAQSGRKAWLSGEEEAQTRNPGLVGLSIKQSCASACVRCGSLVSAAEVPLVRQYESRTGLQLNSLRPISSIVVEWDIIKLGRSPNPSKTLAGSVHEACTAFEKRSRGAARDA